MQDNIKQFNNFQTSYRKMIANASIDLLKINVEYYHHDFQSEPFLHIEGHIENITLDHIEEYGHVISVFTKETTLSFIESNYHTNLSNDCVIFSSKFDDETYCIIQFI